MNNRAWIACTKWSSNDAYLLVKRAANRLNKFGYNIELKETKRSDSGFEKLMPDGSLYYEVGVKELVDDPRKIISIHEALAPTVACFHEVCGHGWQWRNETQKEIPLSKVLLLNDLACKSSAEYYGVSPLYDEPTHQYFEQPHEIAAQYMGLKMTQRFLSAVYDEKTADKLLCEYVNLRIASDNEFISAPDDYEMETPADGRKPYMKPTEPFNSMSQVYEQFQKTFEEQVFKPVDYTVKKDSVDFVGDYINDKKWPWERIWSRKQDMSFPENISDLIQNTPVHPSKNDLDLELLTEDDIDFTRAVEQIKPDTGQKL